MYKKREESPAALSVMPVNYSDYYGYDYLVGRGMPYLGTMGSTLESFMTQLVKQR
jgi:hypothetical protein